MSTAAARHRVVIVGGGFGGLYAARALRGAPVEVTLVDRQNHHVSWFGHDDWEPLALLVLVRWAWSFATRGRSNRLITGTLIADDKET